MACKGRIKAKGISAVFIMGATVLLYAGLGCGVSYADEGHTGTGETSLVIHLADDAERGGTGADGEYANPDADGDGLGDNLAFTVPIRLDFAALANGTVVCPSQSYAYLKNESRFGIRVSALDVDEKNNWHIVADALSDTRNNVIDLQIGPANDLLDASSYLDKNPVAHPAEWNMAPKGASGQADRVWLQARGHVNNVTANIQNATAFGLINWYVKAGNAS